MAELINNPQPHTTENTNMDEIVPNLWVGNILSTYNTQTLKEYKITHVLSLIDKPLPLWLTAKYKECGITHIRYQILDEGEVDILPILAETYAVIEKHIGTSGILVHCGLGISRSGSVAVGYLMRSRGIGRDEALALAREKRGKIQPNEGFWGQLEVWGARENQVVNM
ncbi:(Phosphotyrosine protein) phosphatases II [Glarea lozoyensis ATCC 20868]|uniref:(Phosphotyrosine protein) phosphatases II n=1 Tax=Glarea lozoyensis (strain ATCC 20868 / MF5171) TaxID=1116229 RepID=S3CMD0_GLAL2|nr:(Phosphotyrosine protein) phosphatases II [Glarea lozoyensis ATCC 20868]EPE27672.1 (Phosphotyrosine protein) phosphatases II [Glarea lozoyensis ATCC 20868]